MWHSRVWRDCNDADRYKNISLITMYELLMEYDHCLSSTQKYSAVEMWPPFWKRRNGKEFSKPSKLLVIECIGRVRGGISWLTGGMPVDTQLRPILQPNSMSSHNTSGSQEACLNSVDMPLFGPLEAIYAVSVAIPSDKPNMTKRWLSFHGRISATFAVWFPLLIEHLIAWSFNPSNIFSAAESASQRL